MSYHLMNKDNKILSFSIENAGTYIDGKVKLADEIIDVDKLPLGFKTSDILGSLRKWLDKRKSPQNRKNISHLIQVLGAKNREGFIKATNGASLNDTFWAKETGSNLKWKDVSFYQNSFDEQTGELAFSGTSFSENFSTPTPELSTNGLYAKCWIKKMIKHIF